MDLFQKIVLAIATFLLILILVGMFFLMRTQTSTAVFPPAVHPCPDGWQSDGGENCYYVGKNGGTATPDTLSGSGYFAVKTDGTYTDSNGIQQPSIHFSNSDPNWTANGGQAICGKKQFVNQYGIYWDGVSNTNQC